MPVEGNVPTFHMSEVEGENWARPGYGVICYNQLAMPKAVRLEYGVTLCPAEEVIKVITFSLRAELSLVAAKRG